MRDEFRKIIGLWLQQGVSGFRIDAAPFLIDLTGTSVETSLETAHTFLRELRDFAIVRQGNVVLLGEVDVGLSTIADYFGGGNELQALFSFPLNRFTFLGLAQKSADPIKFGLGQLPTIPDSGQWVNFLRNHDELNLSQLTKVQQGMRNDYRAAPGSPVSPFAETGGKMTIGAHGYRWLRVGGIY